MARPLSSQKGFRRWATRPSRWGRTERAGRHADAPLRSRCWRTASSASPSIRPRGRSAVCVISSAISNSSTRRLPIVFNEYLYERFETSDWNKPTVWHRVEKATLRPSLGPVAQVMQVTARPVGVESLTQTVVLYEKPASDRLHAGSGQEPVGPSRCSEQRRPAWQGVALSGLAAGDSGSAGATRTNPVACPSRREICSTGPIRHSTRCGTSPMSPTAASASLSRQPTVRWFNTIARARPRSREATEGQFEKTKAPITTGRLYLYLMDNMFDVNVRWDQPGAGAFRLHAAEPTTAIGRQGKGR